MGYLTNFHINLYNDRYGKEEFDKVVSEIEKVSGYHFKREASDSIRLDDATWYDSEKHLRKVAEKFPDLIIELISDGEAVDDFWEARFHGDKFERQDSEIVTPPFRTILFRGETEPQVKYQGFHEALDRWLKAEANAHRDAIEALRNGPIDLTEYPFGRQPYFFISQEMNLICKKVYLDGQGEVTVDAASEDDPGDACYQLEWADVSQDIPTLSDFMDCIYGNKNCAYIFPTPL